MSRIYNFSAGPAVLPLPVLEEAQRDLVALPGVGMSVMEISHRSKPFDEIIQGAEADMRTLAGIPANYKVLFLQGGASLQFSMVPMNLLAAGHDGRLHRHGRLGEEGAEGSEEGRRDERRGVDRDRELQAHSGAGARLKLTPGAAYVHMTSNNTIHRHRVAVHARRRRRAARLRRVVGHLLAADRRRRSTG